MNENTPPFDDNAKKDFLAFLDHELRNPLAVILSSVELLQMLPVQDSEAPELIESIHKQVRVITGILENSLNAGSLTQNPVSLGLVGRTKDTKEQTKETAMAHAPTPAEHTRVVLLVDDNEIAAEALKRLLESEQYQVVLANHGAEAIRKAQELHPSIIILDIGLPDMDGYEVMAALRQEKGFLPTYIALTGYGQTGDKMRAKEAGFHAHLTKPVGLREIRAILLKHSPEAKMAYATEF